MEILVSLAAVRVCERARAYVPACGLPSEALRQQTLE